MSKLVPQPQLLVARGLSTILNCDPINSIVKSTLLPFSSSRDGPSRMIFGSSKAFLSPAASLSSAWYTNMVSSSRMDCGESSPPKADGDEGSSGGNVTRLIRYWKPWQPPLSTWIRSAR